MGFHSASGWDHGMGSSVYNEPPVQTTQNKVYKGEPALLG